MMVIVGKLAAATPLMARTCQQHIELTPSNPAKRARATQNRQTYGEEEERERKKPRNTEPTWPQSATRGDESVITAREGASTFDNAGVVRAIGMSPSIVRDIQQMPRHRARRPQTKTAAEPDASRSPGLLVCCRNRRTFRTLAMTYYWLTDKLYSIIKLIGVTQPSGAPVTFSRRGPLWPFLSLSGPLPVRAPRH